MAELPALGRFALVALAGMAGAAVLAPLAFSLLEARSSSLGSRFRDDVNRALGPAPTAALVVEADLASLPPPVGRYLRYAGVLGKPRVHDVLAEFSGQIRAKPDGAWLDFRARQRNFFAQRARYFYLEASMFGLPVRAYHRYAAGTATMEVKALSLVTLVDARGNEMDTSETVTMLNDMCVLAPATLLDPTLRWEALDTRSARVTFENAGHRVSAVLLFDAEGKLESFYSDDRYLSSDGKTFTRYRWTTPLSDYQEFGGMRLAKHGVASWRMPAGELVYGRFELERVHYNVAAAP
jgi:uncharacterized protein DUF6544